MQPMIKNFWLIKSREKQFLKIIEWAQRHNKKMEELTKKDIIKALKA